MPIPKESVWDELQAEHQEPNSNEVKWNVEQAVHPIKEDTAHCRAYDSQNETKSYNYQVDFV